MFYIKNNTKLNFYYDEKIKLIFNRENIVKNQILMLNPKNNTFKSNF